MADKDDLVRCGFAVRLGEYWYAYAHHGQDAPCLLKDIWQAHRFEDFEKAFRIAGDCGGRVYEITGTPRYG